MKISLVQMDVIHKDVAGNIALLDQLMNQAVNNAIDISGGGLGELVVTPELFSTGYLFDHPGEIHQLAESIDGKTVTSLITLAKKYHVTLVAGIAEKRHGEFYNSVIVVNESGLQEVYRKLALTNLDKQYFSRGDELVTFKLQGICFGIAICFDLWFPEITRLYAQRDVDVLLHPANFGGEQSLVISRARAIENAMYVATCNRVGIEETQAISGHYCGGSQIIDPTGNALIQADDQQALLTVELPILTGNKPKRVIGVPMLDEALCINTALQVSDKHSLN
ncbi:carbon-nitrogen hydrolase family protein [Photobacterium profundum]|uniref:carbon-nitrogen hydrolase family protein n=1 Tax=Photobacterium profundum TaxID=74109 RepID=UPI003D11F28C